MLKKILKKKNLDKLLAKARRNYRLIAPVRHFGEDILLADAGSSGGLPADYVLAYNSLKDFFFPQSEALLPAEKNGKGKKLLFFGVRPCDVKALIFQDLFFGRKPEDAYYLARRQRSLVIAVACSAPGRNCFCLATHSGPSLENGDDFDLQFTDIGDEFVVEAGNKKGEDFISAFPGLFAEPEDSQLKEKDDCQRRCRMKMGPAYEVDNLEKRLKQEDLDLLWQDLGRRCTNCGGCEFICPTCFCFNLQDYPQAKQTIRMRSWDSCTYEGYSRMSGGFNPAQKREERIKKRFYCKLYHARVWFGRYGCVGCGRCTSVCPANLEMESFIHSLTKGGAYRSLLKEI